jgi:hypothetical protein
MQWRGWSNDGITEGLNRLKNDGITEGPNRLKKEQILALHLARIGFLIAFEQIGGVPRKWLESAMSSSRGKMFLIQASTRFYMTPNMLKNTRLLAFMEKSSCPAITAGKT